MKSIAIFAALGRPAPLVVLALLAVPALLAVAGLGIAPARAQPAAIGRYGEWTVNCEASAVARRCTVVASDERWGNTPVGLIFRPEQHALEVAIADTAFTATARVDLGPEQAGDCLRGLCAFGRGDFAAALGKGTLVFVIVRGESRPDFTFVKNLHDLRRAAVAAQDWLKQHPQ